MATGVAEVVASGAPSLEELLDSAAEAICRDMADVCVLGVLFDHQTKIHPLGLYHQDERLRDLLNEASELAWEPLGGISERVLSTGVPVLLGPADLDHVVRHPRLAEFIGERPAHSALVVPMRGVGTPVGVMAMGRTVLTTPFTEEDFVVSQLVADRLGLAISVGQLEEQLERQAIGESDADAAERPLNGLTEREREIFRLIGEGLTSREVAEQVFLSVRTVEWHRARLMAKLGVTSRSDLIALAREMRP